jgi:hypothetical protein
MSPPLYSLLLESERVEVRRTEAPPEWTDLLLARRRVVYLPAGGTEPRAGDHPRAIFPGSFNPPHAGHVRMAQIAAERLGERVWLEISITNVDKPPLDFLSIRERVELLVDWNVCLTRAATFVEKAELFPGATFIVGADTLARIAQERYYRGSKEQRDAALARLAGAGTRFLVFGRTLGGHFMSLDDLPLPACLAERCEAVSESEFREDVSSTELRNLAS